MLHPRDGNRQKPKDKNVPGLTIGVMGKSRKGGMESVWGGSSYVVISEDVSERRIAQRELKETSHVGFLGDRCSRHVE